jgi:WD40 repeat protein
MQTVAGEPLRHRGPVIRATFSPDGAKTVTASDDGSVCVWNVATGLLAAGPLRHDGPVKSAVFSPDGAKVLTASWDTTARVWDAETGEQIGAALHHKFSVIKASFSHDGSKVATACAGVRPEGYAALWDTTTGLPLCPVLDHDNKVLDARFSPDDRTVLTAGWDGTARLWDAASGTCLGGARYTRPVVLAAFSPDGTVVLGGSEKVLGLTATATHERIGNLLHHEDLVMSAAFSPDGSTVVATTTRGLARLWDTMRGERIRDLQHGTVTVTSAAFSADGSRLVTTSDDGSVRIWEVATGAAIGALLRHPAAVKSACFSPDGSFVLTACADGAAWLWPAPDAERLPSEVPDWAREWARALVGLRFSTKAELVGISPEERLAILNIERTGDDAWSRLARWVVTPRALRTLHPNSTRTLRELAERERDVATRESLESALRYDPTVPLARIMLARLPPATAADTDPAASPPSRPATWTTGRFSGIRRRLATLLEWRRRGR